MLASQIRSVSAAAALLLLSRAAGGQVAPPVVRVDSAGRISGIVRSSLTGVPIPFARITLQPSGLEVLARADGTFVIPDVDDGKHAVVVRQIGFAPARAELTAMREPRGADALEALVIQLTVLPFVLDTVHVVARGACTKRGFADADASPTVRAILDQVALNAEQYRLLVQTYPIELTYVSHQWLVTSDGDPFRSHEDTVAKNSQSQPHYEPGRVLERKENAQGEPSYLVRLPGFGDYGEAAFQQYHCFRYAGLEQLGGEGDQLYRVDFEPTSDVETTDVAGSLYLDPRTYLVRRTHERVVKLPDKGPHFRDVDFWATFRELRPFFVVPYELEGTQTLINVRADDGRRLTQGRQSDRLVSHRFVGANPDATAAPTRGAPALR